MYDGIIFDQDGVLLDSGINKFHWMDQIRITEAKRRGINLEKNDIKTIVHASSHENVEELLNQKNMSWKQLKQIEQKKESWKIERIEKGEIKLFPKVDEVLEILSKPTAMVTNAPLMSTKFTLNYFGINNYFDHINAPRLKDMKKFYDRKKPAPVMIEESMEKLDMENPVMIGDSGSDITAAENAGIDSIHLNTYGFETETEPTYTAESIVELLEILDSTSKN